MPRENTESNSSEEQSGSGFKMVAIILAVALAGTAFSLYNGKQASAAQAEADAKTITTFSNQVTELRTRLALEQGTVEIERSNRVYSVNRRTGDLLFTSNRLVQTALLLSNAQHEVEVARASLAGSTASVAALETQRDQLRRELEAIPALEAKVAELNKQCQDALFAAAARQEVLGRLETENAALLRSLEDPVFLRLQTRRAEDLASVRAKTARKQTVRPTDSRVRLELMPDGTVRPSPDRQAGPSR